MSVLHLWDLTLELRITTLGAESSGGTVNILNLSEPLDLNSSIPTDRTRISEIASFECTVWTADCSHDQKQAVVGKFFPPCLQLLKSLCYSRIPTLRLIGLWNAIPMLTFPCFTLIWSKLCSFVIQVVKL